MYMDFSTFRVVGRLTKYGYGLYSTFQILISDRPFKYKRVSNFVEIFSIKNDVTMSLPTAPMRHIIFMAINEKKIKGYEGYNI